MTYTLLPPDGIVRGSIDNHTGTKADLWLNVSLFNTTSMGAFYSRIQTLDKQSRVKRYTVSSNCPVYIKTLQGQGTSIKGDFQNTITYNPGNRETVYNCRIDFTATQESPFLWTGAFTVVYPDGRKLSVSGTFSGSVTVKRQIEGSRNFP